MSAYRFVTLTCDDCGEIFDESDRTIPNARSAAKRLGWTRDGKKDLCPRHNGYKWFDGFGWVKEES